MKDEPSKEYYTFEGWTWTNTETGEVIAAVAEMPAYDVTITAEFERVPVTLKLVAGSTAVVEKVEEPNETLTGYIYGLETKLRENTLRSEYLSVEGDGRLEVTLTKFKVCGTGAKVEVVDNVTDEVVETYYIIIFGDINGDSAVDSIDTAMLDDETLGITCWSLDYEDEYDYCKLRAGDLGGAANEDGTVGDGYIQANDEAAVREVVLDGAEIDQQTGIVTLK